MMRAVTRKVLARPQILDEMRECVEHIGAATFWI